MNRGIFCLALTIGALTAHAEDTPAPPAEQTVESSSPASQATPTTPETEQAQEAQEDASAARPQSTGSLRETVTETMRTFTPSEAIDVDKPVDFPANI